MRFRTTEELAAEHYRAGLEYLAIADLATTHQPSRRLFFLHRAVRCFQESGDDDMASKTQQLINDEDVTSDV